MKRVKFLLIFTLLLFSGCKFNKSNWFSEIVVLSGNSFDVEDKFIALDGIKAPALIFSDEIKEQAKECNGGKQDLIVFLGGEAKKELKTLLPAKVYKDSNFLIEKKYTDSYGRIESKVSYNGLNINVEMVKRGYAIPNKNNQLNTNENLEIVEAADIAKSQRNGLWKDYAETMQCLYNLYMK